MAAMGNIRKIFGDKITLVEDAFSAIKDADAVLVLTEWNEFKQIDLKKVRSLVKTPLLFDGRNIYDPIKMKELGFTYFGVGRADTK
jgi:UDPglucose 6-dehydrogenase